MSKAVGGVFVFQYFAIHSDADLLYYLYMDERQPIKRTIYYCCTVVLGLLLSFLAHAAVEILYIKLQESRHVDIIWHKFLGFAGLCALPMWLEYALLIAGIIFGYWLGTVWWRIVYIEHRRWKSWKNFIFNSD